MDLPQIRGSRVITTSIGATTLYYTRTLSCQDLARPAQPALVKEPKWQVRHRHDLACVHVQKSLCGPQMQRSRGRPHDGILTLSRSHRTAATRLLAARFCVRGGLAEVRTTLYQQPSQE